MARADGARVPKKRTLSEEEAAAIQMENRRLREEIEYLRLENEYLKKSAVLVRREERANVKRRKSSRN